MLAHLAEAQSRVVGVCVFTPAEVGAPKLDVHALEAWEVAQGQVEESSAKH